jgi:hypothetical protein
VFDLVMELPLSDHERGVPDEQHDHARFVNAVDEAYPAFPPDDRSIYADPIKTRRSSSSTTRSFLKATMLLLGVD